MMVDETSVSGLTTVRGRILDVSLAAIIVLIGTNLAVVAEAEHGIPSLVLPLALLCLGLGVVATRGADQSWWSAGLMLGRRTMPLGWVLFAMGAYASALAISSIGALRPSVALVAAQSWVAGMVIVAAVVVATSLGRLRLALWAVVGCVAIMAIPTAIQRITGTWESNWLGLADAVNTVTPAGSRWRSEGPIESNAFGAWLVIMLPLVVAVARIEVGRLRLLALAVASVGVVAVLSTYSRGALIGLAVIAILGVRRFVRRPWIVLAGGALVVTAIFPSIWADQVENLSEVGDVVTGSVNGGSSTAGHASTAEAGILMFLDHPTTGVGARNFVDHYLDYVDRVGIDDSGKARSAHNSYVQIAAETGAIGLVVVAAAGAFAVRRLRSMRQKVAMGRVDVSQGLVVDALWLSVVGFLVTSVFTSTSHPQVLWIVIALAVHMSSAIGESDSTQISSMPSRSAAAIGRVDNDRSGGDVL